MIEINIFLKVFALLFLSEVLAQSQHQNCKKCVDVEGNSCDDIFKQYGKTKYWVFKGGVKLSFYQAKEACEENNLVIAEIDTEEDENHFNELIQHDGQWRYWIGLIIQQNEKRRIKITKPDLITKPIYHPPVILSWDISKLGTEIRAVSIDTYGTWYTNYADNRNKFAFACQFRPGTFCYNHFGGALSYNQTDVTPTYKENKTGGSKGSECPEPNFGNNQFIRTGHNSKYLYPKAMIKSTPEEASVFCESAELEVASVETLADWKHLIFNWAYNKKLFEPGMNAVFSASLAQKDELGTVGQYLNARTGSALSFQQFNLDKQNYILPEGGCLSLHCEHTCSFRPIPCGGESSFVESAATNGVVPKVTPLCQYKKNSKCYKNSPLALFEKDEKDELILVGSTAQRQYFGSRKQKGWRKALDFCSKQGKRLLSFIKNDTSETQRIFGFVRSYKQTLGVSWFTSSVWTSGKLKPGFNFNDKSNLKIDMEGKLWNYEEAMRHFNFRDQFVQNEKERCMTLVGSDNNQAIRPLLCDIPNYFICWEEMHKKKNETLPGKGTTTTKKPVKKDSSSEEDSNESPEVFPTIPGPTSPTPPTRKTSPRPSPPTPPGGDSSEVFPTTQGPTSPPSPRPSPPTPPGGDSSEVFPTTQGPTSPPSPSPRPPAPPGGDSSEVFPTTEGPISPLSPTPLTSPRPSPTAPPGTSYPDNSGEEDKVGPEILDCNDTATISFNERGMTHVEILELVEISTALRFSHGYSDFLHVQEESRWRIPHVKAIGVLTKKLCGTEYISSEFLNLVLNYAMIYFNSLKETPSNKHVRHVWKHLTKDYPSCIQKASTLEFKAELGLINGYFGSDSGMKKEYFPISMIPEVADSFQSLDYITEGIWFMFQASAAACLPAIVTKGKTQWVSEFFYNFRNDFTESLSNWWMRPGETNYGVLFGDLDLFQNLYNLRACATAGFQRYNATNLIPVRPLFDKRSGLYENDKNRRLPESKDEWWHGAKKGGSGLVGRIGFY